MFYGTDWDVFAAAAGRYLEKNPPEGTKVVEYRGGKDWPGLHNKQVMERYPYIEDIPKGIRKGWRKERKFFRNNVVPYFQERTAAYHPFFTIDLHSTLVRDCNHPTIKLNRRDGLKFDVENYSRNPKSTQLLCEYYLPFKKNWQLGFGQAHSYHHFEIEMYHNDTSAQNKPNILTQAVVEINDFIQFMRVEYPKLWKKYNK